MRTLIALLAAFLIFFAGVAETATKKKKSSTSTKKKSGATAKKGSSATASSKKSANSKKSASSKKGRTTRKSATTAQTWRSRQLVPTPDRYREIQQALIDKGYFTGEATGTWDQASIGALRRFQQEQNLEPTGKINSLSLIALGLGPKYDTAAAAAVPPLPPPKP